MMNSSDIEKVIRSIKRIVKKWKVPIVSEVALNERDPFHVLISCLLSLRTKDNVTRKAYESLFELADKPETISKLSLKKIEKAIFPAGFYRTKARTIKNICGELIKKYNSSVPDTIEELLKLKGVGRKTANLVVTAGYNKPGICVDTHVHRISNRLGYIRTKTPEQTEFALRKKLPQKHWIEYNDLLVTFGQNMCKPVSPFCSQCPVEKLCSQIGITHSR